MLSKTFQSAEAEKRIYQAWEESGAFACDPASRAEERIQYRALLAQVSQLPERQRDAISLRHSGLSFDEVGKLLGCSEDAAKMLYHRALRALKEAVAREGV